MATTDKGGSVYTTISLGSGDLEAKTFSETTTLKTDMEIIADSSATVAVDDNSKKIDGNEYTLRIKLSGTGSTTKRAIHCTNVAKGTYKIAWISGSKNNTRAIVISDGTNQLATAENNGNEITSTSFTVSSDGGDVYIYGEAAINIYGIYQ